MMLGERDEFLLLGTQHKKKPAFITCAHKGGKGPLEGGPRARPAGKIRGLFFREVALLNFIVFKMRLLDSFFLVGFGYPSNNNIHIRRNLSII